MPWQLFGNEETTGAPSSFAGYEPRRPLASSRDEGGVVNRPPSTLTMLLSRHTRRREFIALLGGAIIASRASARAGDGELHRALAELQRQYFQPPADAEIGMVEAQRRHMVDRASAATAIGRIARQAF